jgi:hypothetical protein
MRSFVARFAELPRISENVATDMIMPRLRPRLEITVPLTPEAIAERTMAALSEPESPCRGRVGPDQIELSIRSQDRHFWSPQLNVLMEPHDSTTTIGGNIGPNPDVWTLFLAAYAFVVLSAITGLFIAAAQLTLGTPPWALVAAPTGLVLVAAIYFAAGVGQRLGREQADVLVDFLERVVGHEHADARTSKEDA